MTECDRDVMGCEGDAISLTRIFLSAIKTLGAETTAIDEVFVAPSSNAFASVEAVSSEYWHP